jgi:hypothetical protein
LDAGTGNFAAKKKLSGGLLMVSYAHGKPTL